MWFFIIFLFRNIWQFWERQIIPATHNSVRNIFVEYVPSTTQYTCLLESTIRVPSTTQYTCLLESTIRRSLSWFISSIFFSRSLVVKFSTSGNFFATLYTKQSKLLNYIPIHSSVTNLDRLLICAISHIIKTRAALYTPFLIKQLRKVIAAIFPKNKYYADWYKR